MELKQKKLVEKQLATMQSKKYNIAVAIGTLESATTNQQFIESMKVGNQAMKHIVKETDLDKADEVMDEAAEIMDDMEEMDEIMGRTLGPEFDEDELNDELNELNELQMDEELAGIGHIPNLANPAVANPMGQQVIGGQTGPAAVAPAVPQVNKQDEQAELDELAQLMG